LTSAQEIGAAVGLALLTAVAGPQAGQSAAALTSGHRAALPAAVLAALGVLAGLALPRPAATDHRPPLTTTDH
jgi:hypothetical protein